MWASGWKHGNGHFSTVKNVQLLKKLIDCSVLKKGSATWLHVVMSGTINVLFNYKTSTVTARTLRKSKDWNICNTYRVIHKSLRNFRTRLRNNQDIHGRKEHINR